MSIKPGPVSNNITAQLIWESLPRPLNKTVEAFQNNNANHNHRVSNFAVKLARKLSLDERQLELIQKGSLLHDIGKISVPIELLNKPSKLDTAEFEIIKNHTLVGAALLEQCPQLRRLVPIIRHHHEHFNGNGYPDNIYGRQIEFEARLISIADAVEAMSSNRPYRSALSTPQIIKELIRCNGTQFDPCITKVAIQLLEDLKKAGK